MKNKAMKIAITGVLSAIMLTVAILLPIGFAYGWFSLDKKQEVENIPAGTFKVVSRPYFAGTDFVLPGDKIVSVNLHDATAPNYIEKFRLDVDFEGEIEALMRVKINMIWTKTMPDGSIEYPRMAAIDFNYQTTLFANNLVVDSCYYYCDSSDRANLDYVLKKGAKRTYSVIGGINSLPSYDESLNLDIFVESQIVQKNRWKEVWNITELPLPKFI